MHKQIKMKSPGRLEILIFKTLSLEIYAKKLPNADE